MQLEPNEITKHQPFVRAVAGRIVRERHGLVEFEDVFQIGMLGVVEAATRWDHEKGSWTMWAQTAAIHKIYDYVRVVCGRRNKRKPTPASLDYLREREVLPYEPRSLTQHQEDVDPFLPEYVNDMLRDLPPLEQTVVDLRYRHDLTLGEIGKTMGFTESRTSQLLKRALKTLRADSRVNALLS